MSRKPLPSSTADPYPSTFYPVSRDPLDGDWTRCRPWVLKKGRYETTFSRFAVDRRQPTLPWPGISDWELAHIKKTWIPRPSKPQTALVSISAHLFGVATTAADIESQLRFADDNDRKLKQVPAWHKRRRR
jgi:hypothetical protein